MRALNTAATCTILLTTLNCCCHTPLAPCDPAALQLPAQEEELTTEEAPAGATQLLDTLAQLTNLKQLDLTGVCLDALKIVYGGWSGLLYSDPESEAAAAAAAARLAPFSALTASSQLESLTLAYRSRDADNLRQPLPALAAAVMSQPGRQLTALTELVIAGLSPTLLTELQDDQSCDSATPDPFKGADGCMWGADLPLLLSACPKLRRLTLNTVMSQFCTRDLHLFVCGAQVRLAYRVGSFETTVVYCTLKHSALQ